MTEPKIAQRLKLIVRYIMFKRQFVLYKDKGLLDLPHYIEFVQTVSKGVGITSFYTLQYLQISWTGLEGASDGYTLNKSTYDSLEIICSFDF